MHGAASTALGASLHIFGSVAIVWGQTTLKVAQLVVETSSCKGTWKVATRPGERPPQWRSPDGRWRAQWLGSKGCSAIGWGGFVAGNIMRFAAMRFGAQAVLSALTSFQFVVIPVASYTLLGEEFTCTALVCIAVVLFGNGLIIANGPAERVFSLDELRRQWGALHMKVFIGVMVVLFAMLRAGILYVKRLEKEKHATQRDRWRARMKPNNALTFAHALLFSASAAMIGANSVLFSKSLTYILTAPWPSQLADWYCWAVLFAFVATGGYWIHSTAVALRKFNAGLVMSVMQAFWMLQSIVAGGFYFDEFAELSGWRAAAFSGGLVAAIAGALGMGCASFVAEQHAMISYTVLPGFGTEAESLMDRTRMTAYGLQFAGLGAPLGPTEMQLQDLSPRSGASGSDGGMEEGPPDTAKPSVAGLEQPEGQQAAQALWSTSKPGHEHRDAMQSRDYQLGSFAPSVSSKPMAPAPAAFKITANAQVHGLAPPPVSLQQRSLAAAQSAAPALVSVEQLHSQQRWPSSNDFVLPGSPDGSNPARWGSTDAAGGRLQAATDMAVLSHHAAAINASLTAAGTRLAAASSRSGQAPAQNLPAVTRALSAGGTNATTSMHSASSGRSGGDASSEAGSGTSASHSARHARQPPVAAQSTAGSEAAAAPLLGAGAARLSSGLSGAARVLNVLDNRWQALYHAAGR